jgi:hypothetical protein
MQRNDFEGIAPLSDHGDVQLKVDVLEGVCGITRSVPDEIYEVR